MSSSHHAETTPPQQRRPDLTTMQGMIWAANSLLDCALDPKTNGVPRSYLERCRGVLLLSTVEVGFVFSGNVGAGVLLARHRHTGQWSPPSAVGVGGVGFGVVAGAGVKQVLVVLMDEQSLGAVAQPQKGHIKLGAQISLVVGPVGREAEGQFQASPKGGPGIAMAWSFSKGLFAGVAMEGAVIGARNEENARFYGTQDVTPAQILLEDGTVTVPDKEANSVYDLHYKLELMQAGKTRDPTEDDMAAKERYRKAANAAGLAAKADQGNTVHFVGESNTTAAKDEYMAWLQRES